MNVFTQHSKSNDNTVAPSSVRFSLACSLRSHCMQHDDNEEDKVNSAREQHGIGNDDYVGGCLLMVENGAKEKVRMQPRNIFFIAVSVKKIFVS